MYPPGDEIVTKRKATDTIISLFAKRSNLLDELIGSQVIYHCILDAAIEDLKMQILDGE